MRKNNSHTSYKNKIMVMAVVISLLVGVTALNKKSDAATVTLTDVTTGCAPDSCLLGGTLAAAVSTWTASIIAAITQARTDIVLPLYTLPSDGAKEVTNAITYNPTDSHIMALSDYFTELWVKYMHTYFRKMTSNFSVIEANRQRMLGSLMDAKDQNNTMEFLDETSLETKRKVTPSDSLMVSGTMVGGIQRATTLGSAYNLAGTTGTIDRTSNKAEGTNLEGIIEAYDSGKAADIARRWNEYVTRYCEVNDNNGNSGCTVDQPYAGDDIDIAGTIFGKETIDLTDADKLKSVNDLVTNIAEPIVKDYVLADVSGTISGKRAILEAEEYKAKRQVIYDAINHIVARRLPGSQMGKYLIELRSKSGINTESVATNPSYNEIMHTMLSERFRSGEYGISQIGEPENNAREIVVQNAFFVMQLSDMLDLMDKQAMLLTAKVSGDVYEHYELSGAAISSSSITGGDE